MAIPTVLRKADFPTLDFTESTYSATYLQALNTALTTFGWELEFSDVPNNIYVFSNTGSGYMLRVSVDDNSYVLFETAQSWSDIDTPVNLLFSQFLYIRDISSANGDMLFIGDSQRFFTVITSDVNIDTARFRISFVGDIVPFKATDPYTFIATGVNSSAQSTVKTSSSNSPGVLVRPLSSVTSTTVTAAMVFFGDADGTLGNVSGGIIAPGSPVEFHRDIDETLILSEQPTILVPLYAINNQINANINGTQYANFVRGIIPGFHVSIFPSRLILDSTYFDTVNVGGVDCITIPSSGDAKSEFVIALNDWSNLI